MNPSPLMSLALAALSAAGVLYLYTTAIGWRGYRLDHDGSDRAYPGAAGPAVWLRRAGIEDTTLGPVAAALSIVMAMAAALTFAMFGGVVPALFSAVSAGVLLLASYRNRKLRNRTESREAWPSMIEEIRTLTGSLGRSVPHAFFEVGGHSTALHRDAFAAGEREWLLTTDFARAAAVVKGKLADPTADVVIETLLVANELGGPDLGSRLAALAEDRRLDLVGRKDAEARLAGARFARLFVILVPLGMAFAGMAVGNGRSAYASALGQIAVVVAFAMMLGCWIWASRIMTLPDEQRVFAE